jgi:hypothetical protein
LSVPAEPARRAVVSHRLTDSIAGFRCPEPTYTTSLGAPETSETSLTALSIVNDKRTVMTAETRFLDLPDGKLAYDDQGSGPLVVATSAMIELRSQLRFLVPQLTAQGLRVVTIDQRGMGESGTSNGAAATVIVAARRPDLVRAIVLAARSSATAGCRGCSAG